MNLHVPSKQFDLQRFFAPRRKEEELTSQERLKKAITSGLAVIGGFVLLLGIWVTITPLAAAVIAPGVLAPDGSTQTIRRLESGIVKQVYVHNGDNVRQGQLLMRFDEVDAKAQVDVLKSQYLYLMADRTRWLAESRWLSNWRRNSGGYVKLTFPPELEAGRSNPAVDSVLLSKEALFESRLQTFNTQAGVLNQRKLQLDTQQLGLKDQMAADKTQLDLAASEHGEIQSLYERGFAPKTRLYALERTTASLLGDQGRLRAALAQARLQEGEAEIQFQQLLATRQTEISTGLGDTEEKLADVLPHLDAAGGVKARTEVRSPVAGYIFNMAELTEGQAAAAGAPLLEIVPTNRPLIIQVKIRPQDAHQIAAGMYARINLAGVPRRKLRYLEGHVRTISADSIPDPKTGEPFFAAEVVIDPKEMRKITSDIRLFPGMPASTIIVTKNRTVLEYLLGPIRDSFNTALREE